MKSLKKRNKIQKLKCFIMIHEVLYNLELSASPLVPSSYSHDEVTLVFFLLMVKPMLVYVSGPLHMLFSLLGLILLFFSWLISFHSYSQFRIQNFRKAVTVHLRKVISIRFVILVHTLYLIWAAVWKTHFLCVLM